MWSPWRNHGAGSLWETGAASWWWGQRHWGEEHELATAPAPGLSSLPSHSPFSVLTSTEATVKDDMNSYISQYYNGPSSGKSVLVLFRVYENLCVAPRQR